MILHKYVFILDDNFLVAINAKRITCMYYAKNDSFFSIWTKLLVRFSLMSWESS